MCSKPSGFLWSSVGVLGRLQYPWRWLAVVSALAVVSISLSLGFLVESERLSRGTAIFGTGLLIFVFAAADVKQIHGTPHRLSFYGFNDLAADVRSQSVAVHWWPAWAKKEAFQISERVTSEHPRTVEIAQWGSEERRFAIGGGEVENLRVATFYYPYWRAAVNGRNAQLGRDENGAITIPVGREPAQVDLRFEEPRANAIARWLSAAVWVFLFGMFAYRFRFVQTKNFAGIKNEKTAAE